MVVPPVVAPVLLESDWSPVELEVELLSDWSPVVEDVLLESDWSPVLVVLSIVRLERPRKSMFGLNVDVLPVTEFCEFAVEPVTLEVEDDAEPVTEGGVDVTLPVEGEIDGCVVVPLVTPDVVLAWLSGMQSWWTGLEECSFAFPVSLFASLPAFGLFSELQRGLVAVLAVVVCARTGDVPMTAAAMRLRVKGIRFMVRDLLSE
jgi:hypothetical protein